MQDIAAGQMNKVELKTLEAVLYVIADSINALMADQIAYGKVKANVPAIQ